ncbi:MAG: CinA family protein [Gammaproteobacteria bacterium]|nr:CinA family protein [Gammaproteobacteria bacterium]
MQTELINIVKQLGLTLTAKDLLLTTAESCTGGMVASTITSVPGSAKWFERGFVTYSNTAKEEMLGVDSKAIMQFGAVSEEVVLQMAEGALENSHADLSLAITGIAGPTGDTIEKPIGTVCFAWAGVDMKTIAKLQHFSGDRTEICQQATEYALTQLLEIITSDD